jgi:outer membrane protein assembly factor BamA
VRGFLAAVIVVAVAMNPEAQEERIAEILVHGNHATPTADVAALAALRVGDPATPERLALAEERLRASGRFETVEIRRRYRSIADPSAILIVVVVNERGRPLPMLLPVVARRDGHALTYGGRVTFVDVVGDRSRISAPLTWGGERRAAVEIEKMGIRGSVALRREINPHFDLADARLEVRLDGEHALTPWLRAGAGARVSRVTFGATRDRVSSVRASVTVDTRHDPVFPRAAVHARVGGGVTTTSPLAAAPTYEMDLQGYVGVAGPAVLAVRAQARGAGSALPLAEWALLGGAQSVRGYRAGYRAGENLAAISAELRVPVNSLRAAARVGVRTFVEAGAAWRTAARARKQPFDRGIGGGLFIGFAGVSAGVDVAWPERGRPRVHGQLLVQ